MADISTFDKAQGKLLTNERNKSTTMHRHKYIYKVISNTCYGLVETEAVPLASQETTFEQRL